MAFTAHPRVLSLSRISVMAGRLRCNLGEGWANIGFGYPYLQARTTKEKLHSGQLETVRRATTLSSFICSLCLLLEYRERFL